MRELARQQGLEGCVTLAGWVDRAGVKEALADGDVVVMPSFEENFGMAAAEAMAAARPVVVGRGVNLAADILTAGAGLVVDRTAPSFADALLRLAREPADRVAMGLKGRAWARSHFSVAAVGRQMVAAYESARRSARCGECAPA